MVITVNNLVKCRDVSCFPRENIERMLEFHLQAPAESNAADYEVECAICYSYVLCSPEISFSFS